MGLDAELRRQLTEAREVILGQLHMMEGRSSHGLDLKRGTPDFSDVYPLLKKELREIDELLGNDASDEPNFSELNRTTRPQHTSHLDAASAPKNVVTDDRSYWNAKPLIILCASVSLGAGVGFEMHHLAEGMMMGLSLGMMFAITTRRSTS